MLVKEGENVPSRILSLLLKLWLKRFQNVEYRQTNLQERKSVQDAQYAVCGAHSWPGISWPNTKIGRK
ncbi:hypothetical protein ACOMHN_062563 [Nucella lapillus]